MNIPNNDLHKAVALARPGSRFAIDPENYGGLRMLDGTTKPTMGELQAAWNTRPPVFEPTDRQLILWLMRTMTPAEKLVAFEEATKL